MFTHQTHCAFLGPAILAAIIAAPAQAVVASPVPTTKTDRNFCSSHREAPAVQQDIVVSRTASKAEVQALKRLTTRPSMICAKVEFAYSCLSGNALKLARTNCRAGATEATCCEDVRREANKICRRARKAARKAGKPWVPGLFLCKCIASPVRRQIPPRIRHKR